MEPMVTFVIPCYNHGHFLPACVNSILAQTWTDFEVLIMDNCSLDNTARVAQSFGDSRIKHIRNESNLGHIRNFNKGIAMATGKYVWLISADDSLRDPRVLARYVDVMEGDRRIGYAFCRAVQISGDQEFGTAQWTDCGDTDAVWDGRRFLARLVQSNCLAMSSSLVRKECYKITYFPDEMPFAADWYIWCMFAMRYRVAYFAEPMVNFHVHEQSLTSTFNRTDVRICVSDEIAAISRVDSAARLAGISWLHNRCIESLATRWAKNVSRFGTTESAKISEDDLGAIVRQRISDPKDFDDIRSTAQIMIGDDYYWAAEYDLAAQSYLSGLQLRPWRLNNWTKYILLQIGTLGIALRRLVSEARGLSHRRTTGCFAAHR
jgi:glycosyltransferase involved in cell wall biosynthesis